MESIKRVECIPKNYSFEYSNLISRFKNALNLVNIDNITIDDIRKYSRVDRENIIKLIDELTIRGFSFKSDNPNSMLPKFELNTQDIKYIYTEINMNRYLNLNLKMFGLGDFCNKYKVDTDKFFNYIPLECFRFLNSKIDIGLLEKYFVEEGFSIILYNKENEKTQSEKNIIDVINFHDNLFSAFLIENNIKGVEEISRINKNYLLKLKGCGITRIRKIEEELKRKYNVGLVIDNDFGSKANCEIETMNFSKSFISYCKRKDKFYLKDLSDVDLTKSNVKMRGRDRDLLLSSIISWENGCSEDSMLLLDNSDNDEDKFDGDLKKYFYNFRFDNSKQIMIEECYKNNIKNIEDLNKWDYKSIVLHKNATPKAVEEIIEFLEMIGYEYYNEIKMEYLYLTDDEFFNSDLKLMIEYANNNNIKSKEELKRINVLKFYITNKYNTVSEIKKLFIINHTSNEYVLNYENYPEINGKTIYQVDFIELFKKLDYDYFTKIISDIDVKYTSYNITLFIYKNISLIKENIDKDGILINRFLYEKTLQEIAVEENVTRERIRQKEEKLIRKVKISYVNTVKNFLNKYFSEKGYIDLESMLEVYSEDNAKIIYNLLKEYNDSDNFKVVKELDIILLRNINIISIFEDIISSLDSIYNFDEELENIENIMVLNNIENIPIEYFKKFLELKKYKIIGNMVCRESTKKAIFSYVVKKYYKNGINIEEKFEEFVNKIKEIFGDDIDGMDSQRAIKAVFDNNLIFCDTNIYTHIDNVIVDKRLLREIKKYLKENLKERIQITYSTIYEKYENTINALTNINHPNFLGSILRYYFDNEFTFYRSSVSKKNDDVNSQRMENFEKYILEQNRMVPIKEIEYKFAGINWNNLISMSDNLLYVSYNKSIVHTNYLNLDDNFMNLVNDKINELMKYGCISIYVLFDKLKLDCIEKNIVDANLLLSIIKLKNTNNYNFYRNFIVDTDIDISTFSNEYLFEQYFQDYDAIYRNNFYDFINDYGYKESAGNAIIDELTKFFYKTDIDCYISPKKVEQPSIDLISQVDNWLEEKLKDKEYCVLNNFVFDMKVLPVFSNVSWNEYSMESFINKFMNEKYRIIQRDSLDWRYNTPVIVKNDSQIKSFSDLIIYMIKREFNSNVIPAKEIIVILLRNGLKYKTLPKEFLLEHRIIYKDNYIILKGE